MSVLQTSPGATTVAVNDSEIFDPAEAMERVCEDLELLAELTELFAGNRDQLLVELAAAVTARDADGVAHAAHALKGSVSTFTTKRPYAIARELEFCGKDGRLDDTPQLLDALQASLVQLEMSVMSFLSSNR